jgi:hypothetical protein
VLLAWGRRGIHVGFWWERDHWKDLDIGGKMILTWILAKYDGFVWTRLIWLRIGITGELL